MIRNFWPSYPLLFFYNKKSPHEELTSASLALFSTTLNCARRRDFHDLHPLGYDPQFRMEMHQRARSRKHRARMSREVSTSALHGHAAAAQGTKQGRVSAFTSRHHHQASSPAATLYVMAAAHGHGRGGRKRNRGNLARGATWSTAEERVGPQA